MNDTKAKYRSVLQYFAADAQMASQDFFSTLSKFIQVNYRINCINCSIYRPQAFVETRETVDRLRKAEEKKAKALETAEVKNIMLQCKIC